MPLIVTFTEDEDSLKEVLNEAEISAERAGYITVIKRVDRRMPLSTVTR